MTAKAKRIWAALEDVLRINIFCAVYCLLVLLFRVHLLEHGMGPREYVVFKVMAGLGFVAGFIAVLPRVSVGGRIVILSFRYKWQPYLMLLIYCVHFIFTHHLYAKFVIPTWGDDEVFQHFGAHLGSLAGMLALSFMYFASMWLPLLFCRLPRVLILKTTIGPFSLPIEAFLLYLGYSIFVMETGESANYCCLFLYITLSISAGMKRPHRKRLRK